MRHLREIRDHGLALEILAQGDRKRSAGVLELGRLEELAERDNLRARVRHLHSHGTPPRNRGDDANARGAHGEREIVREIRDLPHLDAGRWLDLELRHHGTGGAPGDLRLDTERAERIDELHAHGVELLLSELGVAWYRGGEKVRWR